MLSVNAVNAEHETAKRTIVVAAAVIFRGDTVLLTRRAAGTHLENMWEFPGGKVEQGEDPRHTIERELREELGVEASAAECLEVTFWRYPTKDVLLLFFVTHISNDAIIQHLQVSDHVWATRDTLSRYPMPPADERIVSLVRARLSETLTAADR